MIELGGRHRLQRGSLVQIPGWMAHRVEFQELARFSTLNFDSALFPADWTLSLESQRFRPQVLQRPRWEKWFERFRDEPEQMLPRLSHELEPGPRPPVSVRRALALAHEGAQQGWGPGEIARRMDYSLAHLTSEVARHTGRSLGQWVTEARLDLAAMMLRHPDYTVAQVAESCGYADLSHFRRAFKKRTGRPPSQFRQEIIK